MRHLMEGFHKINRAQRLARLKASCGLTDPEVALLGGDCHADPSIAENFIENAVGFFPIPLGIATYFCIDGRDLFIPMAVEETSIIAAASATAKWIRRSGTISTYSKGNLAIGQIQIPKLKDMDRATRILNENRQFLIELANELLPSLVRRGGGVRDLAFRPLDRPDVAKMLVIHVLCDPCDAMGANLINQVCEGLKSPIEQLTGECVGLCILSNLVDGKLCGAQVTIRDVEPKLVTGIAEACLFAKVDPYRATTHNKGVLNGIDPILIATGNDWRAVEAGIHAFASRSGTYQPVTDWRASGKDLVGTIEIPMAVGTVGGVTTSHPFAKIALKILGVTKAEELARICVAVGLVQNLGALKALSTDGIVKGHMNLHAANLAIAAGASVHEIAGVRAKLGEILSRDRRISLTDAQEALHYLRRQTHADDSAANGAV